MLEFAQQLQAKAMESRQVLLSRRIIDTKIDQPQAEIVIDHDKVAALGLNLQQVGADISAMIGGNFVNRFNIAGRSLQGDPANQAGRALESGPARRTSTSPDRRTNSSRSAPSRRSSNKTVPRSLNRLQQLNAVTISGVSAIADRSGACKLLEDEAAKILPKGYYDRLHRRVAAAARRGRQVPARVWPRRRPHLSRPRRAV